MKLLVTVNGKYNSSGKYFQEDFKNKKSTIGMSCAVTQTFTNNTKQLRFLRTLIIVGAT